MTLNAIWIDLTTKVATVEVTIDIDHRSAPTPGNSDESRSPTST